MKMSVRDSMLQYISDGHKDAYGYRPDMSRYTGMSDAELEVVVKEIDDAVGESIKEDERRWAIALANWEQQIAQTMESGAADRDTAIYWLLGAEQFDGSDLAYGASYVSYHFGMFTGMSEPHNIEIQRVINTHFKDKINAYMDEVHYAD